MKISSKYIIIVKYTNSEFNINACRVDPYGRIHDSHYEDNSTHRVTQFQTIDPQYISRDDS